MPVVGGAGIPISIGIGIGFGFGLDVSLLLPFSRFLFCLVFVSAFVVPGSWFCRQVSSVYGILGLRVLGSVQRP